MFSNLLGQGNAGGRCVFIMGYTRVCYSWIWSTQTSMLTRLCHHMPNRCECCIKIVGLLLNASMLQNMWFLVMYGESCVVIFKLTHNPWYVTVE